MKLIRFVLLLLTSFPLITLQPVAAKTLSTQEDAVVVADIHGAYSEFTGLLRELKLIDNANNWSGGNKLLISLGDLVDRGPDSRKVIELLTNLQSQAKKAGGSVEVVLGNHEILVMTGDYRYTSKEEFASFSDLETPQDRALLKQHFEAMQQAGLFKGAEFDAIFPKGFMGLYRAYLPDGVMGKWLRQQSGAMIKLNDALLVHGGVSRETAQQGIEAVNNAVEKALADYSEAMNTLFEAGQLPFILPEFDGVTAIENTAKGRGAAKPSWMAAAKSLAALRGSVLFSSSGPFWYRGNVNCLQIPESYTMDTVKKRLAVSRILVGHTVKYRKVATRFDGDLVMLDTGMLKSYYKGVPSALLISGDSFTPYHASRKFENTFIQPGDVFKHNPSRMSDSDLESFLTEAKVVSSKRIGTGITNSNVIELEKNGNKMRALFKTFDNIKDLESKTNWMSRYNNSDRYHYEVVSYKLDRALGLYMIPAAVIRTVNGKQGVVQYWVEDGFTENNRRDKNLGFNGYCDLSNYNNVRVVFDTLIYNVDRNNGNLLWDKDFQLTFLDHSQSFGTAIKKPSLYSKFKLRLSDLFKRRLEAMSDADIDKAGKGLLNPKQLEALKERKAFILKNALPAD